MINFKKEKDMYDMFIDKDVLTTQELLSLGFNSNDLTSLVVDGKLKRVKRGYYELPNVNGLLLYAKVLYSKRYRDQKRAKQALEKCGELDPNNGSVYARLLINAIYEKNWEKAVKCFEVLDKTDNENYKKDQNLWLFLLSFVTELPEEYKERVSQMKLNDLLTLEGDKRYEDRPLQNKVRNAIMAQKFNEAYDLLSSGAEQKNTKVCALITKGLLPAVISADILSHNHIYQLIDEEKYEEVERLLQDSMNVHGITSADKQILNIVKDLRLVLEEKELPEVEEIGKCKYLAVAIEKHDYKSALKMFNKNVQARSSRYIGILLTRINEEIVKLENEKTQEEAERAKAEATSKAIDLSFSNVTSHLMRQDVGMALEELDKYLGYIGASAYKKLIVDLIKLGLLDKDMAFVDAMYELSGIQKDDYQFDASIYIRDFYYKLVNKDFKRAAIYLDIVAMSGDIGGVHIDTTDMKKALVSEMKRAGVKQEELEVLLPEPKTPVVEVTPVVREKVEVVLEDVSDEDVEKFYTIPDLVEDVLDGDNVLMLEPMSEEDINMVSGMVSHVPNLRTMIIDENGEKRIVFRYVNKYDGVYGDIGDVLRKANNSYKFGLYEDAIDQYESILHKMEEPRGFIYAKLGMAYYKTTYDNNFCEAIDYLTLATAQSKKEDGHYDFSELVDKLKKRSGYNGIKVQMNSENSEAKTDAVQYKIED